MHSMSCTSAFDELYERNQVCLMALSPFSPFGIHAFH